MRIHILTCRGIGWVGGMGGYMTGEGWIGVGDTEWVDGVGMDIKGICMTEIITKCNLLLHPEGTSIVSD